MILTLFTEFLLMWSLVIVCGCDYTKYGYLVKDLRGFSHLKPASPKSFVRYGVYLPFKYASDFIWMLGKNDFERFGVCHSCSRQTPEHKKSI
jgi:hypothetical protein